MACSYNGVNFGYVLTTRNSMKPVKDPGNADQTLTEIRIELKSILSYQQARDGSHIPPAQDGDQSAPGVLARIRHLLVAPRKPLYYDLASLPGQTGSGPAVIDVPDGRDDAGGPWPDEPAISVVYTTDGTFEITWACVVKLRDCGSGLAAEPLSLRWEDSVSFDETWRATYRRSGELILSTRTTQAADWFRRNKLAPQVLPGFHRTAANYLISRDGLRCDFTFVDVQTRMTPPQPAVDMTITQSESFAMVATGVRRGQVSVALTGVVSANVVQLAFWAVFIAKARVFGAGGLAADGKTIGQAVIRTRESTGGVDVLCEMAYKVTPVAQQIKELSTGSVAADWGLRFGFWLAGQPASPPTPQGKDVTNSPPLPFVGVGTAPPNYAKWAAPDGQIQGPADGVGLAPAVKLFSALLRDPCGAALDPTPYAAGDTATLRTQVNLWNTPAGGQGGTTPVNTAQLSASLSTLTTAQAAGIIAASGFTSLFAWDGQPGVYDYWQCQNDYLKDPGVVVIPTSNPAGTNIKVAHSSKMTTLRKRWSARRTGSVPRLPPEDPGDPNLVLTFSAPTVTEMKIAPDGVSVVYDTFGYYEYQCLDASLLSPAAEIPPFLNPSLTAQAGWFDAAAGIVSSLIGGLIGVPTPLGSGVLPGPVIY